MGGAAKMASVLVGEEPALYKPMTDREPVTPDDLAAEDWLRPTLLNFELTHSDAHVITMIDLKWRWEARFY